MKNDWKFLNPAHVVQNVSGDLSCSWCNELLHQDRGHLRHRSDELSLYQRRRCPAWREGMRGRNFKYLTEDIAKKKKAEQTKASRDKKRLQRNKKRDALDKLTEQRKRANQLKQVKQQLYVDLSKHVQDPKEAGDCTSVAQETAEEES